MDSYWNQLSQHLETAAVAAAVSVVVVADAMFYDENDSNCWIR